MGLFDLHHLQHPRMRPTAALQQTSGVSAMNDRVNTLDTTVGYGQTLPQAERQRVLRNTYWLLALSLLPTVLGAWLGVASGITRMMSPGISMIVFFAGAFGLMYGINRTKNSSAGVYMLLGFTFFM